MCHVSFDQDTAIADHFSALSSGHGTKFTMAWAKTDTDSNERRIHETL
jgi:hypothetical protein